MIPTLETEYRARLREQITKCFDESELRTLCFDLGIDYNDLPGATKADRARELIARLERCGCIPELVDKCRSLRPKNSWESPVYIQEPPPEPPPTTPPPIEQETQAPKPRALKLFIPMVLGFVVVLLVVVLIWYLSVGPYPISTPTPTLTNTLIPVIHTMMITISRGSSEEVTIRVNEPFSLLNSILAKGDAPITITVQAYDQHGNVIAPDTLSYDWESCCEDLTNQPPGDTQTHAWRFRPPTYLLTETITITVSDKANRQIVATIPFTITER